MATRTDVGVGEFVGAIVTVGVVLPEPEAASAVIFCVHAVLAPFWLSVNTTVVPYVPGF